MVGYAHMGKVFPICRGVTVGDICSIQDVSIVKGLWAACERVFQFLNACHRGLQTRAAISLYAISTQSGSLVQINCCRNRIDTCVDHLLCAVDYRVRNKSN